MKERPILFSGAMVRALLDGSKTMTRRVLTRSTAEVGTGLPWASLDWSRVSVDPGFGDGQYLHVGGTEESSHRVRCRWVVGDHLWVRETWYCDDYRYPDAPHSELLEALYYRADGEVHQQFEDTSGPSPWRPSIFMPRWASRITLEITDVRVERVQEISYADAKAEGMQTLSDDLHQEWDPVAPPGESTFPTLLQHYERLWDDLNHKRGFGWETNPWVWVLGFRRINHEPI